MKDDHQNDHLEAAVQTPDGTFYKVIPSKFLWTTLPTPPGRYTFLFSFPRLVYSFRRYFIYLFTPGMFI